MESSTCCIKKPAVTVIVPAYNVEKYIEKCIVSIEQQSISNIEIIAVDDGSNDNTGHILDELAKKDNRITVIHKCNEGVSAARNYGLTQAHGQYITFVDGDDWLASDFVSYMLCLADTTGADFCLSKNCFTQKNELQLLQETIDTLSAIEGIAFLLSPVVIVGCWNKLFKKEFLEKNNIHFSEDLFYGEGLEFITHAAQKANFIGVGNRKVYYYRRNNVVSATTKFNISNIYNGEKALDIIEHRLNLDDKYTADIMLLHRCMYNIGAVTKLINYGRYRECIEDYKRWLSFNRRNIGKIFKSEYVPKYRKMLLLCGCISPKLLAKLDVIRRKRIARNSVVN